MVLHIILHQDRQSGELLPGNIIVLSCFTYLNVSDCSIMPMENKKYIIIQRNYILILCDKRTIACTGFEIIVTAVESGIIITYRTDKIKNPGVLLLGLTKKLPSTP